MDSKKILTNPIHIVLIAMFCCILWGSAFPVLKITYAELNLAPQDLTGKLALAGVRFFLASLLLFLLLKLGLRRSLHIEKKYFFPLLSLGILQTTLQYFFFYTGLANTSGMKSAILNSVGTFFVVILAHFFYHNDRLNWKKAVGLLTGFAGILIINWGAGFSLNMTFMGEGFLILTGLVSAFGTILTKHLAKNIHPFLLTSWQMFLGSLLLLIIGLPKINIQEMVFTPTSLILIIYSAALSAVAFSLWNSLLKYSKAGEIAIYRFFIPVAGSILSVIFLPEEQFSIKMIGALILVALGIVIVNRHPKQSTRLAKIKEH